MLEHMRKFLIIFAGGWLFIPVIVSELHYLFAEKREIVNTYSDIARAAEVPEAEYTAPDPCGLIDVVCDDERQLDRDGIERLIRETFPEDPDTAVRIAHCESRLDPTRVGDTHTAYSSYGVFQIRLLPGRVKYAGLTAEKLLDARANIAYARKIYDRFGWRPWTCARIVGVVK